MRAFIVLLLAFKVQLIIYNLSLTIIIEQITEDCLAGLVTSSTGPNLRASPFWENLGENSRRKVKDATC